MKQFASLLQYYAKFHFWWTLLAIHIFDALMFTLAGKLTFGSWDDFQEARRIANTPISSWEETGSWASVRSFYYLCLFTYLFEMGLLDLLRRNY